MSLPFTFPHGALKNVTNLQNSIINQIYPNSMSQRSASRPEATIVKKTSDNRSNTISASSTDSNGNGRIEAALSDLQIASLPPKPTGPKRVIVVGAGISGLRAAAVLQRHGVHVTVLEGRSDRIGGRILTSRRSEGGARDIGNTPSKRQYPPLCG